MEESFLLRLDELQFTELDFFIRLLVATGIGFIIGLEREHASISFNEKMFAGVRTFVFVVLLGFITAFLGIVFSHWILIAGLCSVILFVGLSYWISANKGDIGGTTEFATVIAFLLGCTTLIGYIEVSLVIMVVVVVMLSLKMQLKTVIGRISQEELFAFIRFVVLSLLIFPFLPDQTYGPYNVFNPREVGWVIILTSGVGFVGYMLMKFFGSDRGILFSGIIGGLVSSTVVSWIFAKKSKEVPLLSSMCAVAILSASTIMVIRVFIWVFIFRQELIAKLILPLVLIFFAGLGYAFYLYRKNRERKEIQTNIPPGNPLNIKEAVFFGLLYTGILILVSYASNQFGAKGIFISTGIAALTDIDAITISVSKLAGDQLSFLTAQNAILLATLSNTIVKIGICLWAGSKELKKLVVIGFGFIFFSGIIGFVILNM